jgi:hypothetical protein
MKKLAVCSAALAFFAFASTASAGSIGIGAFGGASVPLVQADNAQGTMFGVRLPLSIIPLFTVEPYYAKSAGGDVSQEVGGSTLTRSGIDLTSYGANLMLTLGTGFQMYPFAGIGTTQAERIGLKASSTGYNFGLGFGISPPALKLALHLRGEMAVVREAGSTESARKWANVTVGVSYGLLSFPPVP